MGRTVLRGGGGGGGAGDGGGAAAATAAAAIYGVCVRAEFPIPPPAHPLCLLSLIFM